MNRLGISSSCFYPLETERSFEKICAMGIGCAEIFFNTQAELLPPYIKEIERIKNAYGVDVVSVHPFLSFAETYLLFSSYRRRYEDSLSWYERFFEIAAGLGAKYFVFHGGKKPGVVEENEYFERFAQLCSIGKRVGITVCNENVVYYCSEDPWFLQRMTRYVGEDLGIVLDVKQARRAGVDWKTYADLLGASVRHIHISDFSDQKDCTPPLTGKFDFTDLFSYMREHGYPGDYIIELYEHSFSGEKELSNSYAELKKILL